MEAEVIAVATGAEALVVERGASTAAAAEEVTRMTGGVETAAVMGTDATAEATMDSHV